MCDVDKRSLNLTADNLEPHINNNTKAIILNHYGGIPCEMDSILKICKENNILVIEDSACAVRSFYKGNACGTMGDLGIWSFDAMKILCTGDGGMFYIKDSDFMNIAKEDLYLGTQQNKKVV